jgi:predicted kinase
MTKNVLIVMCGLPASGKSTYAEWLAESGVFKRVCPDLIRKRLYGDENIQGDGKKVFETAYNDIKEYASLGENVVFDATNTNAKRRKEFVKEMRPYFDIIILKWFNTPINVCLERNAQRERQVPEEVIRRMAQNFFNKPTIDEGFDIVEEIKNYL